MAVSMFLVCISITITMLPLTSSQIKRIGATENGRGQVGTLYANLVHRDYLIPLPLALPNATQDIRTHDLPYGREGVFLVNISIGEPPLPQLLFLDTGSSLTWVCRRGCRGCEGLTISLYEPSDSSTVDTIPCSSELCSGVTHFCNDKDQCYYVAGYANNDSAHAILARETFRFSTPRRIQPVPGMLFGYANLITWSFSEGVHGILGLGPRAVSMVNDYTKFSYCIGSMTDRDPYNLLIIGEMARVEGSNSTPLEIDGQYYVTLQGIDVGDDALDISPEVFAEKVMIDSGSTFTYLKGDAYEKLKEEIKRILEEREMELLSDVGMCYEGNLKRDFNDFPAVTLQLAEDSCMVLEAENLFKQDPSGMVCLAVKKARPWIAGGENLIGMMAQQNNNIGYDLTEKRLYIEPMKCRDIED